MRKPIYFLGHIGYDIMTDTDNTEYVDKGRE